MPAGRPKGSATYKPEYAKQAGKLAFLSLTDEEIASYFEVGIVTFNTWKKQFPEFFEALKEAKELADAKVAKRLYQRAVGYEHDDTDIRVVNNEIVETPIRKIYPPEVKAAMFWLQNRQPSKWRAQQREDAGTNGYTPEDIANAFTQAMVSTTGGGIITPAAGGVDGEQGAV